VFSISEHCGTFIVEETQVPKSSCDHQVYGKRTNSFVVLQCSIYKVARVKQKAKPVCS